MRNVRLMKKDKKSDIDFVLFFSKIVTSRKENPFKWEQIVLQEKHSLAKHLICFL